MAHEQEKRWVALMLLLRANRQLTAQELAKKLRVGERTVYRDIQAITSRGVPIRSSTGPDGGYYLEERYPLDIVAYGREEAVADFFVPEVAESPVAGHTVIQAFENLLDAVTEELTETDRAAISHARQRIILDTSKWFWKEAETEQFLSVKAAVLSDTQLEILYFERDDPYLRKDVIDPYGLVWREGFWYVLGQSHAERAVRRYRIGRLVGVTSLEHKFDRPGALRLRDVWQQSLQAFGSGDIKVVLKLDESLVPQFETFRFLPGDTFRRTATGAVLELYLDDFNWLVPFILSHGSRITVLEPPGLRRRVIEALKETLVKHTEAQT